MLESWHIHPVSFKHYQRFAADYSDTHLGRFPVTLYYEQWVRLLDASGDLRMFLENNKDKLKLKQQ